MASVLHIFRALKKRLPMEELEEVRVIRNSGLEGCAHGRLGGTRQVLLVDRETLEAMDLPAGVIRENITTDGINVNSLELGQELRMGKTVLKVSAICHPCDQLEKIRPGLRRELRGRRGMLCRVMQGGIVGRGDSIEKVSREQSRPFAEASRSGLTAE
jgi:MOSC domain-containing protein YiiM